MDSDGQQARIEELEAELARQIACREDSDRKLMAADDALNRTAYELAEARKDGERYRYVRDVGFKFADVSLGNDEDGRGLVYFRATFSVVEPTDWPKYDEEEWRPSEIDAAIDAAIDSTRVAEGGKG